MERCAITRSCLPVHWLVSRIRQISGGGRGRACAARRRVPGPAHLPVTGPLPAFSNVRPAHAGPPAARAGRHAGRGNGGAGGSFAPPGLRRRRLRAPLRRLAGIWPVDRRADLARSIPRRHRCPPGWACSACPGLTAWASVVELADVQAGQTVLVSAALGPVGSLVGQLAMQRGARGSRHRRLRREVRAGDP